MKTFRSWHIAALICSCFTIVLGAGRFTVAAEASPDRPSARTLTVSRLDPAPYAKDICPDAPLRVAFTMPPLKGAGKIQVYDDSNDALTASIDVGAAMATQSIGGSPNYHYYPMTIADHEATLCLPNGALSYGKTYYIKIDPGAFKGSNGNAYGGIDNARDWKFSTKAAPPAAGTAKLIVAADGSGDFCTVQGALDSIPAGNTTPTTIFLRKGTYHEIIYFTNRHSITLLGEDRKESIITYANNANFNNAAGTYHRGVFLAHRVNDLVIANLTFRNTTPQGGSQAEAIILNGASNARAILAGVDLSSHQDTLQINGQAYVRNCHIEGDVDFMWGTGPCFFENCRCKSLRSNAYYTQIRNPATNHGYVYKNCVFDGSAGITGNFISRIDPSRFPASEVVLLDCVLSGAVSPVAWRLDVSTNAPTVRFWEYNSHDAEGKPLDMSKRLSVGKRLKLPEDKETTASYSDPTFVLGGDWNPLSAPIFAAKP